MPAERLYLSDAYCWSFDAVAAAPVAGDAVGATVLVLDRTAFYPTGGGQPHDTGVLRWEGGEAAVVDVRSVDGEVHHVLGAVSGVVPAPGQAVHGELDGERRHALMRTHTAMHVLGGVVFHTWGKRATGNNMEPLAGRMDFAFDPLPAGFAAELEDRVNAELRADRPVEVSFVPAAEALASMELIRTETVLVPGHLDEVRIVDIVGLDRQTDGGTHVRSTGEVGRIRVVKTESKGKGNKRVRVQVLDAAEGDGRGASAVR